MNADREKFRSVADKGVNAMADVVSGYLEVGVSEHGEVVINHPDLRPDENSVGHIVFSPNQARELAISLIVRAAEAEAERQFGI